MPCTTCIEIPLSRSFKKTSTWGRLYVLSPEVQHNILLVYNVDFPLQERAYDIVIDPFYGDEKPLQSEQWLTNYVHWANQHQLSIDEKLAYVATALFQDAHAWFEGLRKINTWKEFWFLFREKYLQDLVIWSGTLPLNFLNEPQQHSYWFCCSKTTCCICHTQFE